MPFPVVATGQYADDSVAESKLAPDVRVKLNRAAGEAVTYSMTLAETLPAWVCVRSNGDSEAARCTSAAEFQQEFLGITTHAGNAGETVIVVAQGRVSDSSFSRFTPGESVFIGADGTLVNTPPDTGYIQAVATAMSANELAIMPGLAVLLS